jgi:hypothetical protein
MTVAAVVTIAIKPGVHLPPWTGPGGRSTPPLPSGVLLLPPALLALFLFLWWARITSGREEASPPILNAFVTLVMFGLAGIFLYLEGIGIGKLFGFIAM